MMGLTPREIDALTLPELVAMFDGARIANGGKANDDMPAEPDLDEFLRTRAEMNGEA